LAEIPPVDLSPGNIVRRGPRPGLRWSLSDVRRVLGKTQVEVAEAIGKEQGEVSRLEQREDTHLSTLRRYAEALGARLEVAFVLDAGHRFVLAEPKPERRRR
jgi:transcriptional regulator with XRE-family HTH domain